jgi:hypothetical protein
VGGFSGDRGADQPGGETVTTPMCILQHLNLAVQVLAHRRRPTIAVGHERARGHGCEHNPRRVC